MPYDMKWEARGVYKQFHGVVTGEDILGSIEEVTADRRFDDLRFVINDFLDAQQCAVSEAQVQLAAANDYGAARTNPNIMVAVVTDNERIMALARLYAAPPLAPYPTEIFPSVSAAREWIGSQSPFSRQKAGAEPSAG